jgi:ubiquinone/menaquinone biosynthesis C-methylase UbiE
MGFRNYVHIRFMRLFFYLLYHPFAFCYDLVAALVSTGLWVKWVTSISDFVPGPVVLELGSGPGHLQSALNEKAIKIFGLDSSSQMIKLAAKRLKDDEFPVRLTHGRAQELPFPPNTFNQIVATFPSEYIFSPTTLLAIKRVLQPQGVAVILPQAEITSTRMYHRFAAWLFRITGQTIKADPMWEAILIQPFINVGFETTLKTIQLENSLVRVILAKKR